MYLKSIEMHGFKSFANKIVLDFHNGITGIVGPNGSGKSNVGDAVRWVLGEQSAKQLRGSSMQDVIFAGTENRKPVSYAYVAITLDNSDHVLPVSYDEVTVARRVYRSGESEYLLNGTACRLKDVAELFYDTGIGKEGYSIIGQGQIERILSGKPEERRELFDEAVGIVKFKKRKALAQKKFAEEQDNLVRVSDILGELEKRVGPLEEQAKKAKEYLELRGRQKALDVNLFLTDMAAYKEEYEKLKKNYQNTDQEIVYGNMEIRDMQIDYDKADAKLSEIKDSLESLREREKESILKKGELENERAVLNERITSLRSMQENYGTRTKEIDDEIDAVKEQLDKYLDQKEEINSEIEKTAEALKEAKEKYQNIKEEITSCSTKIEENNKELLNIMEDRTSAASEDERLKTLEEQIAIRRAGLNQRLLARKTETDMLSEEKAKAEEDYDKAKEECLRQKQKCEELNNKQKDLREKYQAASGEILETERKVTQQRSRFESLRNIAERYEGYGNAIKRVMEQKDRESGLVGVVADLISVPEKYETAMETALGGNIQNIVTEDEATAKRMISFLKSNRAGRATFLPLTSVDGKNVRRPDIAVGRDGIIGFASELLEYDPRYSGIIMYLVGRIIIAEDIDSALKLAKKNRYTLNIVTLDGEYLRPGGSMSGGAYRHSGNLLARNREMEEITNVIEALEKDAASKKKRLDELDTAIALLNDDIDEANESLRAAELEENTAKVRLTQAQEVFKKSENEDTALEDEGRSMESELLNIKTRKEDNEGYKKEIEERQEQINLSNEELNKKMDEQTYLEAAASRSLSELEMEESAARQKGDFLEENIRRTQSELDKHNESKERLKNDYENGEKSIEDIRGLIENISERIISTGEENSNIEKEISDATQKREELENSNKELFEKLQDKQAEVSNFEKELMRLENMVDKTENAMQYRTDHMWEEYELTLHSAEELKDESLTDTPAMKAELEGIRERVRAMGTINTAAVEEYQETKERYDFLKKQHDDIVEAAERLEGIIEELDEGMRAQFEKGFKDIQREFDAAFKQLFGGGKGTLELMPEEDILETGIKIIAQPPGKKLQNMMQLSGGEKSLTAIALLFAIQNLKPSPFCLLDEIEAALDDSNVDRFAKYLHKLTENTQFIVITHRRGTMNAADRLYGITMQEKGISTLVSVNLIEDDLEE